MGDTSLSRRGFIKQAALAGSGLAVGLVGMRSAGITRPLAGKFTHDLGFQLYTLRTIPQSDQVHAFQALAKAGFRKVEVLRQGLDQLGPMLKSSGLAPVSGHFDAPLVTGNWDVWNKVEGYAAPPKGYDWKAAVEQATKLGLKYMVVPFLTPAERGNADSYRRLAERLNQAGEVCKSARIRLCYHHHSFEFQFIDGKRPLDLLMERSDRDLVGLELDVFWASVAGADPVEILSRFSGRVPLIHLKDKGKGTANEFNERNVPRGAFKEVGNGVLDTPAILRAAAKTGVEEYIVEQDHCPGDPVASLIQSYRYLRKVVI